LASDAEGEVILGRLAELAKPFGTDISIEHEGTGLVGRIGA
jgi:hypothetical protein